MNNRAERDFRKRHYISKQEMNNNGSQYITLNREKLTKTCFEHVLRARTTHSMFFQVLTKRIKEEDDV